MIPTWYLCHPMHLFAPSRCSAKIICILFLLMQPKVENASAHLEFHTVHFFCFLTIPEAASRTPTEHQKDAQVQRAHLLDSGALRTGGATHG